MKPGELVKVLLPVKVIGPVTVTGVAAVLIKEPAEEMPVPDTDSALGRVMPLRSSAAPLDTAMVEVPCATGHRPHRADRGDAHFQGAC